MSENSCLIRAQGVWKKYARDFLRSLRYAVADIGTELVASKNENLSLRRSEFWAIQDASFELARGDILGLIGPNGAGKSTLLKILYGLIKPSRGRIEINGSVQALIELGGAFSQILTGRENIEASAAILGITGKRLAQVFDEIVSFADIGEFIDSPVATYSTGMKVRLGFSIAMLIQPDILILDEVLAVGDLAFQQKSLARVADIRKKAGAVIFVSHNIPQIQRLCNQCMLLEHGQVVAYGPTDSVVEEYVRRQRHNFSGSSESLDVAGGVDTAVMSRLSSRFTQKNVPITTFIDGTKEFIFEGNVQLHQSVHRLDLDVCVLDPLGTRLVQRTFQGVGSGLSDGNMAFQISFSQLPLTDGVYRFYIAFRDPDTLSKICIFDYHMELKGEDPKDLGLLSPGMEIHLQKSH